MGASSPTGDAGLERVVLRTPDGLAVRRVGPGRRERAYQAQVAALEVEARSAAERARSMTARLATVSAAFDVSQRVERSCQRRLDRLEDRLNDREEQLEQAHRAHKRLALGLGAVQRENELLRRQFALLPERGSTGRPWWRRWLGGGVAR